MSIFDSIKWGVEDVVDWASDHVQNATGETARRNNMQTLANLKDTFSQKVSVAVDQLNAKVTQFNQEITALNTLRKEDVAVKIGMLFSFLRKFGACKPSGAYASEEGKIPSVFPQRELDSQEKYISDNEWSQGAVFGNSLALGFFGMKKKTQEQNLKLQEAIHDVKLRLQGTLDGLSLTTQHTAQDIEICDMYMSNVSAVSNYIQTSIIPELELVEAFFQAEKIKDEVLCDHTLTTPRFSYQLSSLIGTPYEKHYRFVKNTFMFYVLSCKIYNTPVLTNLINQKTTQADKDHLKHERATLENQMEHVQAEMSINRGGKSYE